MGLIGKEIVQSRIWIDPNAPEAPNLNYKYTYPITVYEAVRATVDEDSETLASELHRINTELLGKQHILPAKSADNLVTYGGIAGSVGAIQISQKIPYDKASQRDDRIPTEKAVGELLRKFGLVTSEGDATGDNSVRILYTSVVGRPEMYDELGDDEEGVISQAAMTTIINDIRTEVHHIWDDLDSSALATMLRDHINDSNNPHGLTAASVGAADKTAFEEHVNDTYNPHHVTKAQVGLGNVDNTSDADKPISNSVRVALNTVNETIATLTGMVGGLRFITDAEYIQDEGRLDFTFNDESVMGVSIITDGLVDDVDIDLDTNKLIVTELNGNRREVDIYEITKYVGKNTRTITFDISKEDRTIAASIRPNSINSDDIAIGGIQGKNIANKTITGDNIADNGLVTANYADWSVTGLKIANYTISDAKIVNHGLTGRSFFTSDELSVLAITTPGGDAQWIKLTSDQIADNGIRTESLAEGAVTSEKIAEGTINSTNIAEGGIVGESIADNSVPGEKLLSGSAITEGVRLAGRPELEADDDRLVDAKWVRDNINHFGINSDSIAPRAVQPRHIFTSEIKNRVMIINEVQGDAEWGQIQAEMIGPNAVIEGNIADKAVTEEKIADRSITTRTIESYAVTTQQIATNAVTSEKIYESAEPNMILAVGPSGGHPAYTHVVAEMMAKDSVTTEAIVDQSVTLDKLAHAALDNTVLLYDFEHQKPEWGKIDTKYIANYAVTGEKIFTSPTPNTVLAVLTENTPPVYTKVTPAMMADVIFTADNLAEGSVKREHLQDDSVDSTKLAPRSVETRHIIDRAITPDKLFRSVYPNRVLAVTAPDTNPEWLTVSTEMIDDLAITPEKLFRAERPYSVLAAISPGDIPSYIQLTEDFIWDESIGSQKLKSDLKFRGHPTISEHPYPTSNDYTIASTAWVHDAIDMAIRYAYKGIAELEENSIELDRLKTTNRSNVVIGVLEANSTPVYTTINSEMIDNGSIDTNKLAQDIKLLGHPTLEVRPTALAADRNGGGDLIPDCQWVLDRINQLIKEYDKELREKICCLKTPDPEVITGYKDIAIDDIKDDVVNEILLGGMVPEAVDDIVTNQFIISRIPDERLEELVDEDTEVPRSKILDLEDARIGFIQDDTIQGIVSGDLEFEDFQDGNVRLTVTTTDIGHCCGHSGIGTILNNMPNTAWCCCSEYLDGVHRKYILPIPDYLVEKLADDRAIPEPVTQDITLEGIKVSAITEERILEHMAGTSNPIPVRSTFINDKEFGPIDYDRIEGLVRGYIYPKASTVIEVTEGINVEERNDKNYRYIEPINTVIIDKICNGTADPQYRQPLETNDGNIVTIVTEPMIEQMTRNGSTVTEYSSPFQVHEYQYAPIDVDRIEGLIRGTIEPMHADRDDISESKYIPDDRKLTENSVITEFIQRRAVTGDKLFSSAQGNTVLAVIEPNSDAQYTKITRPMLVDHIITPDLMFTSEEGNKVLAVVNAGEDPQYVSVSGAMIDEQAISNKHLQDSSITGAKIQDSSIGAGKLATEAMVDTVHIIDNAVISRKIENGAIIEEKIADLAVTTDKIKDKAITTEKLSDDIQLPKNTTIQKAEDYMTKQLRNITVSVALPSGCDNGDIWFQYM